MRSGTRCWTGCVGFVALVSIAFSVAAKPSFLARQLKGNIPNDTEDSLADLWSVFDATADKAYAEQAYRDSAGISLLSYLVGSALEDYEKSYTSAQRLAFCYHFLGDTEPALIGYRLTLDWAIPGALVPFAAEKDRPGLAALDVEQRAVRTLMNLGVLCVNARKLDSAEAYFRRVIQLTQLETPATAAGKFRVEHLGARAKTGLADIHQDKGDYGQAVKLYEECRVVFEAEYHYLRLRELRPGKVTDRASMLAAAQQNLAHCLRNLGEAYMDSPDGNLGVAKTRLEESLQLRKEIGNHVLIADSELALGELGIAEHRYDDALRFATSAASQTGPDSASDNPDTYWQALLCQGKTLLELGRLCEAGVSLKAAIRVVEGLKDPNVGAEEANKAFFNSVTWFFRQKVAPYTAMAELCIRLGKPLEALRYAELAKARTLLLGRPLNAVNREDSLGDTSVSSDDLSHFLADVVPDDKTAALEYMFGPDRGYVFLVTRSEAGRGPTVKVDTFETEVPATGLINGGSSKDLASAVEVFRRSLEKSYTAYPAQLGSYLYETLLRAFAPDLATKDYVIIVPTGNLWRIPFEALSTSPTEPSYLVRNYAISYTPSLVFLAKIIERANRERHNINQCSFVLADPQLAARPSAATDPTSVASIFGNKAGFFQTRSFTGVDATRQRFLREAPAANLIVIATHAVAVGNNPVESLFAVTPEQGTDPKGALTAADIMSEALSANLAILSACETEKGRYVEGEGEIGCGWAFLYAGCASTMVSQWRVDRAATVKLTTEFCGQLDSTLASSSDRVSLAALLRSTQLALLADGEYTHPFYWAGIVLVGDPAWRSSLTNR